MSLASDNFSRFLRGSWLKNGVNDIGKWIERLRKPRVLIITGPTAIGKTALSIQLAHRLNGEIISADSVQVYRKLDIGSGKILPKEMEGIPHHLLDVCDPTEEFSAGRFYHEARAVTNDVLSRGKVPIVVGGTGFYLKWFVHGPAKTGASTVELKNKAKNAIRNAWAEAEERKGKELDQDEKWAAGIELLTATGEEEAATRISLERNNYYRLTRALEIALSHKGPMADLDVDTDRSLDYDFRCFFLDRPRLEAYERIERRCEDMIRNGLLEEARYLLDLGLLPNQNCSTSSIGYKRSMNFLLRLRRQETELTDEEVMVFLGAFKTATKRLAKQQINWFRREKLYHCIDLSSTSTDPISQILKRWSKFALPRSNVPVPSLSREEEKALKKYVPRLHYYEDLTHRRELIDHINHMLK